MKSIRFLAITWLALLLPALLPTLLATGSAQDPEPQDNPLEPTISTDDEGREWTSVEHDPSGRLSWYIGIGYDNSLGNAGLTGTARTLSHAQLHIGGGWALAGSFHASASPGERIRVGVNVLYLHLVAQLGIPVADPAIDTYLVLGARLQYLRAAGRHAFMTSVGAGPRWDFPDQIGAEVTLGLGYAFMMPKVPLPIWVQGVWQTAGAIDGHSFGLRIMVAWSLGT